ncbi:glycosyltransferase [Halovivax gelatinilyticus]|uniref:glycosyltransferase n=1 Tax=Halovivax gelatinilyticus TaxID=2961597 RepID=UPI0020CA5BBF|nr:glycosyltransferase [Halovivax gelatinilyticus]
MGTDRPVSVLALTTNAAAPFFEQQVEALSRYGVETTVCAVPGDPTGSDGRSAIDYVRFGRIVRDRVDESTDLIHAHYGLIGPFAFTQRRCPVVLSLWGSDLHHPLIAPISRLSARASSNVVVMSAEMARLLDTDCHVIPDGIDLETFRPMDGERARRSVGWTDGGYDVLFPYAKTRTVKDYPRARSIVERVDRRLSKPVRLRTVSGVSHERVPAYMNAADALLLTSRSEGSPNAVKEAMACELPVVSTPVGDVPARLASVEPSVVAGSNDALVDGLETVLVNGGRSNGRDAARSVGIDRQTNALLAVYEDAIDREVSLVPRAEEPELANTDTT